MTSFVDRRRVLASASALALFGPAAARAQGAATAAAPAVADTNWLHYAADLASSRYAPLDQINAENFNSLEVAWRFSTNSFGARPDAYYNCTPLLVKGRLYSTAGLERYLVALDGATGQLLWSYRHDEKGRLGSRGGSGWGLGYWTDGVIERVLYVTRSYQMISIDAKTGLPDPGFGVNGEVDLRKDWDQDVDPTRAVAGLHAPPLIVKNTVVVGTAATANVIAHLRGFDVRTGKRKWIFHTVPKKGEFGYDTWTTPGQAEAARATGVWAPMSADEELGLVYAGVELPRDDALGVTRHGPSLFSETLVALDSETGERRWHYQLEHHGLWDRDVPSAAILFDLPMNGKVIKALAQPTKQAYLFVLDRTNGKPVWPIREVKVPAGDIPGEWYSPTQPVPSKPPAFDRQGFTPDDLVDFTPEIKARAQAIASHYNFGTVYTPPTMTSPEGKWGTLIYPEYQGGANWPGGSYDPDSGIMYIYSKTVAQIIGGQKQPDGRITMINRTGTNVNDSNGGGFGGQATPSGTGGGGLGGPQRNIPDGLNDPIIPGMTTIGGISIGKPPYGRITAIDLRKGELLWTAVHGETPDFVKNNPLLKGVTIPRTGQAGILGVLTTKTLAICGDAGLFTDEQGRKAARLRAYDKATGKEVGAVFLEKAQTGAAMTYMLGGKQHIVTAIGGARGAELICYRLPAVATAAPRPAGQAPD
jgi:quinoprotein glucose dehydrogenase